MADKQIMNLLNKMLGQMNSAQKQKLNTLLKDEESIKKALSSIDSDKAKKVAKNLHLDAQMAEDVGDFVDTLKKNPDIIQNIDNKPF